MNDGFNGELDNIQGRLNDLIEQVVPWVFGIIASLIILWIIYIGIRYIMATSADKRKEAKEIIKQFVIGLIVLFVIAAISGSVIGGLYFWYSGQTL